MPFRAPLWVCFPVGFLVAAVCCVLLLGIRGTSARCTAATCLPSIPRLCLSIKDASRPTMTGLYHMARTSTILCYVQDEHTFHPTDPSDGPVGEVGTVQALPSDMFLELARTLTRGRRRGHSRRGQPSSKARLARQADGRHRGRPRRRHRRSLNRTCSTTPEALYSWLWALVRGSRVVGGVSPLWRATAACDHLRRTCLGELVGLSGADSGACQSRLGSVMHWRELSAS